MARSHSTIAWSRAGASIFSRVDRVRRLEAALIVKPDDELIEEAIGRGPAGAREPSAIVIPFLLLAALVRGSARARRRLSERCVGGRSQGRPGLKLPFYEVGVAFRHYLLRAASPKDHRPALCICARDARQT